MTDDTGAYPPIDPLRATRIENPVRRAAQRVAVVLGVGLGLLMVVYLVGSLLLTGGEVVPNAGAIYGSVIDPPLFVLPGVVIAAAAVLVTAAALVTISGARQREYAATDALLSPLGTTVIAAGFFAVAWPETGGPIIGSEHGPIELGASWIGAPVGLVGFVVAVVVSETMRRRRVAAMPPALRAAAAELTRRPRRRG